MVGLAISKRNFAENSIRSGGPCRKVISNVRSKPHVRHGPPERTGARAIILSRQSRASGQAFAFSIQTLTTAFGVPRQTARLCRTSRSVGDRLCGECIHELPWLHDRRSSADEPGCEHGCYCVAFAFLTVDAPHRIVFTGDIHLFECDLELS